MWACRTLATIHDVLQAAESNFAAVVQELTQPQLPLKLLAGLAMYIVDLLQAMLFYAGCSSRERSLMNLLL